jgi:hypothetical protein
MDKKTKMEIIYKAIDEGWTVKRGLDNEYIFTKKNTETEDLTMDNFLKKIVGKSK